MLKKYAKKAIKTLSPNKYQTLNWIEISRKNILANFNLIRSHNPGFGIMAVLKANAYGHGLNQIAEILNEADCAFLAVDGYFEAARLRDITKHKILVMGYILPANAKLLDLKQCSFVVQDREGLKALAALNKKVNIHLELNTGMNRLGLNERELKEYLSELKLYPKLNLEGVMTHLADADSVDPAFTLKQTEQFDNSLKQILSLGFKPKYIHIAQTAGSTKVKSHYANTIRLGIGLYGINPLQNSDPGYISLQGLKPALELKSTIIKTIDLKRGDKVSYNARFTASKPARIAVLPLGYYEGVPRALSNKGSVSILNKHLPIRGTVCMNHTMIDISGTHLKVGDHVTVISSDQLLPNSIQQIADSFNLFTYELLTKLSESTRKVIVE